MALDLTGLSLSLALLESIDPDLYEGKAAKYKEWQANGARTGSNRYNTGR